MKVPSENFSHESSIPLSAERPKNNNFILKVAIVAGGIFSLIAAGVAIAFGPLTSAIVLVVTISALIIIGIAASIFLNKKNDASETNSNIGAPEVQKVKMKDGQEASIVKNITNAYVPLNQDEKLALDVQTCEINNKNGLLITFGGCSRTQLRVQVNDMLKGSCTQVVVNAANTDLRIDRNGGVNQQVIEEGKKVYQKEHLGLRDFFRGKFQEGQAAMITSGNLSKAGIEKVIIVAGPRIKKDGKVTDKQKHQLYSCYYNSMFLADSEKKASIAFPGISTGIYNFPKDLAAEISLKAVVQFLKDFPDTSLMLITFNRLGQAGEANIEAYKKAATLE